MFHTLFFKIKKTIKFNKEQTLLKMIKRKNIVILPFTDLSINQNYEHFSDGITEYLISALSKISNLYVISRTSSFYYKNKSFTIKDLSKELKVSLALEGSIRIHKQHIQISTSLINADEDFHLWSESWEGNLDNFLEIQNNIHFILADKLREYLGHFNIEDKGIDFQTNNLESYEHYLKGKYFSQKWNPSDINCAIKHYKESIALDKNHSMAYIGLAECYTFLSGLGLHPIEDSWFKINQLTQYASELTPNVPEVHFSLANIHFWTKADFNSSFQATLKAIEIKPSFARAHQFLGLLFALILNKEKALEQIQIAYKLDPLSYEVYFSIGYIYYMFEDYELALQWLERTLIHNPNNTLAHTIRCCCYLKLKKYNKVCTYFEHIPKEAIVNEDQYGLTAMAYLFKNDISTYTTYKTKLKNILKTKQTPRSYGYLFLLTTLEEDFDTAFTMLNTDEGALPPLLAVLFNDPLAHALRRDSRYHFIQKQLFNIEINIKKKDKKPLIDQSLISNYILLLTKSMTQDQLYLDVDLTLRNLAKHINIHPNQLSWLINDQYKKNFKEFINTYRVEHFKNLVNKASDKQLYLIGLAYESGFNSKTAFNSFFKKHTGITPTQYVKMIRL